MLECSCEPNLGIGGIKKLCGVHAEVALKYRAEGIAMGLEMAGKYIALAADKREAASMIKAAIATVQP